MSLSASVCDGFGKRRGELSSMTSSASSCPFPLPSLSLICLSYHSSPHLPLSFSIFLSSDFIHMLEHGSLPTCLTELKSSSRILHWNSHRIILTTLCKMPTGSNIDSNFYWKAVRITYFWGGTRKERLSESLIFYPITDVQAIYSNLFLHGLLLQCTLFWKVLFCNILMILVMFLMLQIVFSQTTKYLGMTKICKD